MGITGALAVEDLLTVASTPSTGRKRELIDRVADEMRRLHESGVYHADLTMKNIVMSGTSCFIIDLDKSYTAARLRSQPTITLIAPRLRSTSFSGTASGCPSGRNRGIWRS